MTKGMLHEGLKGSIASLAVLTAIGTAPARADYWAFAYSGENSATLATATQTLSTNFFQGWVSQANGVSNLAGPDNNTNYFAGSVDGAYYNNFLVFNISGASPMTTATLEIDSYAISSNVTYTLHNVTTPISSLYDASSPNAAIYNDLGSGVSYGSFALNPQQSYTTLSLSLNSAGVAALDKAIASRDQYFAIGGSISAPEPATWAMIGLGFAALGLVGYRARRQAFSRA